MTSKQKERINILLHWYRWIYDKSMYLRYVSGEINETQLDKMGTYATLVVEKQVERIIINGRKVKRGKK